MLTESLSAGCMGATGTLDGGGGRVMGDVSTLFVIESLEMYEFTNDLGFLQRLMPASLKSGKPLLPRICSRTLCLVASFHVEDEAKQPGSSLSMQPPAALPVAADGRAADDVTSHSDDVTSHSQVITKAIDWMIDIGTGGTPLPKRQCCTYDIIDFAGYDHTTFNSFMYLAAMRACQRIATYTKDPALAAKCSAAYDAGLPFMKQELWNETSSYFRAWSDSTQGACASPWVTASTPRSFFSNVRTLTYKY